MWQNNAGDRVKIQIVSTKKTEISVLIRCLTNTTGLHFCRLKYKKQHKLLYYTRQEQVLVFLIMQTWMTTTRLQQEEK